jgi:hypothetical protein
LDTAQQLHAVMAAPFEKQKLLSLTEYRVFRVVEEAVAGRRGYRVFAQANLGEILKSSDDRAYRSINSKRIDILVVDGGGWPVLAVEYHGGGHYQGVAAARDAVKKEALRKAGVRYLDVFPTESNAQIQSHVLEQLGAGFGRPLDDTASPAGPAAAPAT